MINKTRSALIIASVIVIASYRDIVIVRERQHRQYSEGMSAHVIHMCRSLRSTHRNILMSHHHLITALRSTLEMSNGYMDAMQQHKLKCMCN